MKLPIIHSLCFYLCIASNLLQAMDKSGEATQKTIALGETWIRAQSGEITKKEIQRFLKANVLAISYSHNSIDKKVKLLNKLFTRAFYADVITDPFKKQFYGIQFKDKNNEPSLLAFPDKHQNTYISSELKFASIMEFATIAGNDLLLEEAVKKAILLKNAPDFQEKINLCLLTALDHDSIDNHSRFEIFKKYGISFNIALEDGNTFLHRYGIIPQTIRWLLKNTDIDVNKQNNKGETVAHLLASTCTDNIVVLISIFNQFIKKNLNPLLENQNGRTARNIAFINAAQYGKDYYTRCGTLFIKLEEMFDSQKLSFKPRTKFELLDDGITIHSYQYSDMASID